MTESFGGVIENAALVIAMNLALTALIAAAVIALWIRKRRRT